MPHHAITPAAAAAATGLPCAPRLTCRPLPRTHALTAASPTGSPHLSPPPAMQPCLLQLPPPLPTLHLWLTHLPPPATKPCTAPSQAMYSWFSLSHTRSCR